MSDFFIYLKRGGESRDKKSLDPDDKKSSRLLRYSRDRGSRLRSKLRVDRPRSLQRYYTSMLHLTIFIGVKLSWQETSIHVERKQRLSRINTFKFKHHNKWPTLTEQFASIKSAHGFKFIGQVPLHWAKNYIQKNDAMIKIYYLISVVSHRRMILIQIY